MRPRQKRVNFASFPVERQCVCTFFCGRDLLPAHRCNVDNIYYARMADGDIKVSRSPIEKNHVWSAAEGHIGEDATGRSVAREQNARVAGAKQTPRYCPKIETICPSGPHRSRSCYGP